MDPAPLNLAQQRVVHAWIDAAVRAGVAVDRPATIHIDDLFEHLPTEIWMTSTLAAFRLLVERAGSLSRVVAVACFPLGCADDLSTSAPDWESVTFDVGAEPPSLYLMNADALSLPNLNEEYRRPVALPVGIPNISAYYRCSRSFEGIRNDWEFERALYLESRIALT